MYLFGKDIEYKLYSFEDGTALPTIPAQSYTAYVFTDTNAPNRTQAIAGTNSFATIAGSHTVGHANVIQFTIPAIDDPDPNANVKEYRYWVSINFVLKTGEQTQTILRSLPIARVSAQDKQIGVTASKIESMYPDVYSYLSEDQVSAQIALAQSLLVADLKNKGFIWAQIYRPDELFSALLFKSLEFVYMSQIKNNGDKFAILADSANKNYTAVISNINLSYDDSIAGVITSTVRPSGIIMAVR